MRIIILALILVGCVTTQADTLLIDALSNEASDEAVPRPSRGMNMADVEQRFGPPQQKYPWVGDPAITRWAYDRFTVYFEEGTVLRSVLHR